MLSFLFLTAVSFAQDPVAVPFGQMPVGQGAKSKSHQQALILYCIEKTKVEAVEVCSKAQFGSVSLVGDDFKKDNLGNTKALQGLKPVGPVIVLDEKFHEKLGLSEKKYARYFTATPMNWQFDARSIKEKDFDSVVKNLAVLKEKEVVHEAQKQQQLAADQEKTRQERLPPFRKVNFPNLSNYAHLIGLNTLYGDYSVLCDDLCDIGETVYDLVKKHGAIVLSKNDGKLEVYDGEATYVESISNFARESRQTDIHRAYFPYVAQEVLIGSDIVYSHLFGKVQVLSIDQNMKASIQLNSPVSEETVRAFTGKADFVSDTFIKNIDIRYVASAFVYTDRFIEKLQMYGMFGGLGCGDFSSLKKSKLLCKIVYGSDHYNHVPGFTLVYLQNYEVKIYEDARGNLWGLSESSYATLESINDKFYHKLVFKTPTAEKSYYGDVSRQLQVKPYQVEWLGGK